MLVKFMENGKQQFQFAEKGKRRRSTLLAELK
jgi:hypothetical protein